MGGTRWRARLSGVRGTASAETTFRGTWLCNWKVGGEYLPMAGARVELLTPYVDLDEYDIPGNFRVVGVTHTDQDGNWSFTFPSDEDGDDYWVRVLTNGNGVRMHDFLFPWPFFVDSDRNQNDVSLHDYGRIVIHTYRCEVWTGLQRAFDDYVATTGRQPPYGHLDVISHMITAARRCRCSRTSGGRRTRPSAARWGPVAAGRRSASRPPSTSSDTPYGTPSTRPTRTSRGWTSPGRTSSPTSSSGSTPRARQLQEDQQRLRVQRRVGQLLGRSIRRRRAAGVQRHRPHRLQRRGQRHRRFAPAPARVPDQSRPDGRRPARARRPASADGADPHLRPVLRRRPGALLAERQLPG